MTVSTLTIDYHIIHYSFTALVTIGEALLARVPADRFLVERREEGPRYKVTLRREGRDAGVFFVDRIVEFDCEYEEVA